MEHQCIKCQAELTDQNWSPSSKKKSYHICTICKTNQEVKRRHRLMDNEQAMQKILSEKNHICYNCSTPLDGSNWNRSSAARRTYICRKCHGEFVNEDRKLLKEETIEAYGGKCRCCGESNLIFLTIDHIDETGAQQRKEMLYFYGGKVYLWLKKQGYPKDNYQVLCFNCNFAKHTLGRCPHQLKTIE